MSILSFDIVLNNALVLIILFSVFFWIYKSMKEGRTKDVITNTISKIMDREGKDGK